MEPSSHIILLVDDDQSQRSYVREKIEEQFRFTVLEAEDGLEAAQIVLQKKVSLIVTDLFMPKMNGMEFAYFVKTIPSPPPVIMVSSRASSFEQEKAKQLGVAQFFEKSENISPLIQYIKQALDL